MHKDNLPERAKFFTVVRDPETGLCRDCTITVNLKTKRVVGNIEFLVAADYHTAFDRMKINTIKSLDKIRQGETEYV